MTPDRPFNTGAIRPIECVREAWILIKDDYWPLFAISIVGALTASISFYTLLGAMVCGIFTCYLKKIDGGRPDFADLWQIRKYFWPSLLVTILIVVPIVVWVILLVTTMYLPLLMQMTAEDSAMNPDELWNSFIKVFVIDIAVASVMVCLHSLLIFCYPLIVDKGVSSWESIKLSARAVMANLGGIGSMVALNLVMALAGAMFFCVGIYLVMPLLTASNLVAYRRVFPRHLTIQNG
jgi:hypothetical protein